MSQFLCKFSCAECKYANQNWWLAPFQDGSIILTLLYGINSKIHQKLLRRHLKYLRQINKKRLFSIKQRWKVSLKSNENGDSRRGHRQTDRQTDRLTNASDLFICRVSGVVMGQIKSSSVNEAAQDFKWKKNTSVKSPFFHSGTPEEG